MSKELEVIAGMEIWWKDLAGYTPAQIQAYNSAITRASEAIRRLDNYNETRALFIHRLYYEKVAPGKKKVGKST